MKTRNKLQSLSAKITRSVKFVAEHELLLALVSVIILIIIGSLIGIETNRIASINPAQYVHYLLEPKNKLSFLANWDGVDYISISRHGYTSTFMTGWFPIYPVLIHLVNIALDSSLISALLIAWAALVGAILYYIKLAKLYFKSRGNLDAFGVVLLFLLFPSGIYLLAAYTESLFAFLSLAAIYYALRKEYLLAALFTMFATATHINGIFLLLIVLLILVEEKEKIRNLLSTLIIGSIGLFSYMIFLFFRYHNPIAFITAQRDHGWLHHSVLSHLGSFSPIDYVFAVMILLTVIYWWKRRKSFAIYSALYLLIPLVGGQFGGFPRYSLMVFPMQLMLYEYLRGRKLLYLALILIFAAGWTYITIRFAAGYVVS